MADVSVCGYAGLFGARFDLGDPGFDLKRILITYLHIAGQFKIIRVFLKLRVDVLTEQLVKSDLFAVFRRGLVFGIDRIIESGKIEAVLALRLISVIGVAHPLIVIKISVFTNGIGPAVDLQRRHDALRDAVRIQDPAQDRNKYKRHNDPDHGSDDVC